MTAARKKRRTKKDKMMDFVMPDGMTVRESSGESIERMGRCFNEVGKIAHTGTLDDHKAEILKFLYGYYPEIPEKELLTWYATSRLPG